MENNASRLNEFNSDFTSDYLNTLLNGPHNSSAMNIEVQKINAHVVKEEALMKNVLTLAGATVLLAVVAYLFYMPGIV